MKQPSSSEKGSGSNRAAEITFVTTEYIFLMRISNMLPASRFGGFKI